MSGLAALSNEDLLAMMESPIAKAPWAEAMVELIGRMARADRERAWTERRTQVSVPPVKSAFRRHTGVEFPYLRIEARGSNFFVACNGLEMVFAKDVETYRQRIIDLVDRFVRDPEKASVP